MPPERDAELIERPIERQVVHEGTYMRFVRDIVSDASGHRHTRDIVVHPGAVAIVALRADGQLLLVRQYRHAAGEVLLELPAGTLDRSADGSLEDPFDAARRELTEETGHGGGTWRKLAEFFSAPGFASELMHLYLAAGVEADPAYAGPMEDERLELVTMPFSEAVAMAVRGEMRDAKTVAGLLLVDALRRAGEFPELL